MSCIEVPFWWDRGIDEAGRPIRPDVRAAALAVWESSCRPARRALQDGSHAAQLMETSIAQISRYLDANAIPAFSRPIEGLVAHSFQRAVRRDLARRKRVFSLDSSNQPHACTADESWAVDLQTRLELQQVVGLLVERSQTVLALRYAGYSWKELALVMGDTVPALRAAFWRDINRVRRLLKKPRI